MIAVVGGLFAALGLLVWDDMEPQVARELSLQATLPIDPTIFPGQIAVRPAPATPDASTRDEAAALSEEISRLLRLADTLDAEIDHLVQQARETEPNENGMAMASSELPKADAGGPVNDVALPISDRPEAASVPTSMGGVTDLVVPVLSTLLQLDEAETVALVEAEIVTLVKHPEPVATLQAGSVVATVLPSAAVATRIVPNATSIHASVVSPVVRSRPPARFGAMAARPHQTSETAGLSAAQRRCQLITLRFQLGEKPSNADQRLLRTGCG
jgi:hypothetical protein